MKEYICEFLTESIELKQKIISNNLEEISQLIPTILSSFESNNKILLCGNGGSAADAQHFAAELVGRYRLERRSLPAISLTTDTSNLTAIGNDYGFEQIFSRQIDSLGLEGDVLVVISTSGNSKNLIKAVEIAQSKGMKTIGLLGKDGGKLKSLCNQVFVVPSNNTPRIQEIHILVIHMICEIVEHSLFGGK